jgi:hypothetical protein
MSVTGQNPVDKSRTNNDSKDTYKNCNLRFFIFILKLNLLFGGFFCAIHFFAYLCCMENGSKLGKAIKDKVILSIKKINKNMPISVNGRYSRGYDRYDILTGSIIKITSIRKYRNIYYKSEDNKFVYEIDVEVNIKNTKFMNHSESHVKYILSSRVRSLNDYYRYDIKQYVMDDLKYFGLDDGYNTIISKIKYVH